MLSVVHKRVCVCACVFSPFITLECEFPCTHHHTHAIYLWIYAWTERRVKFKTTYHIVHKEIHSLYLYLVYWLSCGLSKIPAESMGVFFCILWITKTLKRGIRIVVVIWFMLFRVIVRQIKRIYYINGRDIKYWGDKFVLTSLLWSKDEWVRI